MKGKIAPIFMLCLLAIFSLFLEGCKGSNVADTINGTSSTPINPNTSINQRAILVSSLSPAIFRTTEVSQITNVTVSIQNVGTDSAFIDTLSFDFPGSAFTILIDYCSGTLVVPGDSCGIVLRYSPHIIATDAANLDISYKSANLAAYRLRVPVQANAIQPLPVIAASPSAYDFSSVTLGSTSTKTIIVANNSTASATFQASSVSGSGYTITNDSCSGVTLNLTSSPAACTVTLQFSPSIAAVNLGQLNLNYTNNASVTATNIVQLTGIGAAITARPILVSSLSPAIFATTEVAHSNNITLNIQNVGTDSASFDSVALDPSGSPFSILLDYCSGIPVAPGDSCGVILKYAPTAVGSNTSNLKMSYKGANQVVNLLSVGVQATAIQPLPSIAASPTAYDFSSVTLGSTSTKTIIISNNSTAVATFQASSISGNGYTITNDSCLGLTLSSTSSPGACTITLQFAPVSANVSLGQLSLHYANASSLASTSLVQLTGIGSPITARPILTSSVSPAIFATTEVSHSNNLTLNIQNVGTDNATFDSIGIDPSTGTPFSIIFNYCSGVSVAPGESCGLVVGYSPTSVGSSSANLKLTYKGANLVSNLLTIAMQGNAIQPLPAIAASPTAYDFGLVTLGSTSTKTIIVSNNSTAAATFQASTLSGTGYTISNDSCSGLSLSSTSNPAACTVTLQFAPSTASFSLGQLVLHYTNSSSVASSSFVQLAGIGNLPQTTLTMVSGNQQTTAPGLSFADPLKVQLLYGGAPVTNQSVSFAIISGPSSTLSSSSTLTDSSGMSQINVTAGATSGTIVLRATYLSISTDFTLTITNQTNATIVKISGDSQSAPVGTSLSQALVVEARDASTSSPLSNILIRFSVASGNGHINTSSNSVIASTDSFGRASVNFDLGTIAGANSVAASIVSVPGQAVSFSSTGSVPSNSAISLAESKVTSADSSLTADGSKTTTLTLTIRDIYGNAIPIAGKAVVFSVNTGSLIGSVTDVGNGVYRQTLRAPSNTTPSYVSATAGINGSAITSTPANISLLSGSLDLAQSLISVSQSSIVADGITTALVTVTLKDTLGNQLSVGGQTVSIATNKGSMIGSVTDNGNGTYSQTIKSITTAGTASLSATVSGSAMSNTGSISFVPGNPDMTKSVMLTTPSTIVPGGTSSSIITVQLRDSFDNICTNALGKTIVLTKSNGTWSGSATSTITAADNSNGTYSATLFSATSAGSSLITGTYNGVALTKTSTVYFSNGSIGPNVGTSTISIAGGNVIPANGSSVVTVTVQLKDSFGVNITSGGSLVTISTSAGSMIGSVVDNGNGTYSRQLRAAASASLGTVSATVDGNSLTNSASVSFYGSISLATSTISVSPASILAGGLASTVIYLNARDVNNVSIPVGGETGITFTTNLGTLLATITDNGNGTYSQQLQSSVSTGTATVGAIKSANPFSATTTVEYFSNANNRAGLTIDCANVATYANSTIIVDNGTLTMNSKGSASSGANCAASFIFNGIILQNNGVLTHGTTTITQEYGLELTANYMTIDSSSRVDMNGKGYAHSTTNSTSRVQGNQDFAVTSYGVGGSYGGYGALYNAGTPTNLTYGSLYEPIDLGSSGGSLFNSTHPSGSGGGRIKLTITGSAGLINNGIIRSNGGTFAGTHAYTSGGSGGSVWINTTALSGTGSISAVGSVLDGGNTVHVAPGGGGRVAIYYTTASGNFSYPTNMLANISTKGTVSSTGCTSGAGTVYLKSPAQTYGDLIIDNKGQTTCTTTVATGTGVTVPTIAATDSVTATTLVKTGAFGDTYSTTSPFKNWYIDPNSNQNATAKKADNSLYKIVSATADVLTTTGGTMTSVAASGNAADLVLAFDNLEIGDGTPVAFGNTRVISYGGDLRTNDTGTFTLANSLPPKGLEFVGLTNLNLNLTTKTLPAFTSEDFGTATLAISNGTYNFGSMILGNLTTTAMTLTGTKIKATGNVSLSSTAATLTQTKGSLAIDAVGSLDLTNTSTITQGATTLVAEYSLEVQAGSVSISANSGLSAFGKGFIFNSGARVFGNQNTALTYAGGALSNFTGSHGGRGGNSVPEVWGSFRNPYTSGGSGGAGSGGGIIRVTTLNSGPIVLNGSIDARAASVTYAGAGGSIYINGGTLSGAGYLDARGGTSGSYVGGGGRIAVYYTTLAGNFTYPTNALLNMRAWGGDASSAALNGAAGTVFLKGSTDTYGKLLVNNNNLLGSDTSGRRTVISSPTIVAATGLSYNSGTNQTTLTLVNAFSEKYGVSNAYIGAYLNPNIAQNATQKIQDDSLFEVVGQTADSLTVTGNATSVASAGNTFQLNYRLNDLKVVGNSILEINNGVILTDDLEVTGSQVVGTGSVETNSVNDIALTGIVGGTINLNHLQTTGNLALNTGTFIFPITSSVSSLVVTGNLSATSATLTGNVLTTGQDLTLTSSTSNIPLLTAGRNFSSTGSIINATKIKATGNITLNSTTATLTQPKGNLAIEALGALDLSNLTTVTQGATTTTVENSLEIQAASVSLSANSTLSAIGKGYVPVTNFRVFGNQNVLAYNASTQTAAGGSHGGRGGVNSATFYSSEAYGSYKNPNTSGGSGGNGWATNGLSGGGIIRVTTLSAGAIVLNGAIDVRGSSGTGYSGAGGSIYLNAGALSGTGYLDARGGAGTSGGGSGGRIAVYYTSLAGNFTYPTNAILNMRAYGGDLNSAVSNGSAGTVFLKSNTDTFGKLIINNNSLLGTDSNGRRTVLATPTIAASTGVSYNSSTDQSTITLANAFGEKYGVSNAYIGTFLNPNTAQNGTQKIQDDRLFEVVGQTTDSLVVSGNATSVASAGNTFQLNYRLNELKVIGNSILEINNGVILTDELEVTNSQIVGTGSVEANPSSDITLSANSGTINLNYIKPAGNITLSSGTFTLPNNSNITIPNNLTFTNATLSGSGHTFSTGQNLTLTSTTLSGTGHIFSIGQDLAMTSSSANVSSLSAGRDISLSASTLTSTGNISATRNVSVDAFSAVNQTVGFILGVGGNLSVNNSSTLNASTINAGGTFVVDNLSTVTTGNRVLTPFTTYNTVSNVNVTGDTSILNGSLVATPASTSTEEYYLYFTTPNLTLGASASINVDSKGYKATTTAYFRSLGNANYFGWNGTTTTTQTAAGGSYGGQGGSSPGGYYPNRPYGTYQNPIYLGSSSGYWNSNGPNETGGGAVRLNISNTALINGSISASGAAGSYSGGSGGSVYLQTNILNGSGTLKANGGSLTSNWGTGGGGRIAIYYSTLSGSFSTISNWFTNIQAYGGTFPTGSTLQRGSAGTVYLKGSSQTYGDLIVNNNNVDSSWTTYISTPATTLSTAVTASTLSTSSAFTTYYNVDNFFAGLYLNPNTAQNGTNKLSDDALYLITSNTANTLTSGSTNVNTYATAGNSYSMYMYLDNLEVRGLGKINFAGQNIAVMNGDLSSNNTTSFVQDGWITAKTVDLTSAVNWSTTVNAGGTVTTKCSSNNSCP